MANVQNVFHHIGEFGFPERRARLGLGQVDPTSSSIVGYNFAV